MKNSVRVISVVVSLFCAATAFAQTPAPAAKAAAPAMAASSAMSAPAATGAKAAPAKAAAAVAAGGGAGKVWVNTKSKVYHCEGSKAYGTTKSGEYMTEVEAKAKGNHGVKGQSCAK